MMGGYGNYGYGGNSLMGGGGFGFLLMLLFGALVIAGIVMLVMWAVRSASGHGHVVGGTMPPTSAAGHDEAIAIAKRRLASGEIDKDKYDEIRRALDS